MVNRDWREAIRGILRDYRAAKIKDESAVDALFDLPWGSPKDSALDKGAQDIQNALIVGLDGMEPARYLPVPNPPEAIALFDRIDLFLASNLEFKVTEAAKPKWWRLRVWRGEPITDWYPFASAEEAAEFGAPVNRAGG